MDEQCVEVVHSLECPFSEVPLYLRTVAFNLQQ